MKYSDAFQLVQSHIESLAVPQCARMTTGLNRGWRFHAGDVLNGAQAVGFDDSQWRQLDIPHDWSAEGEFSNKNPSSGSGGWVQTGVVWYRKTFAVADAGPERRHFILFDGVSMNSSVWVNGHLLGQRPYGFSPFWYDVTPWVKAGENLLAVRADTSLQPYSRFYHGTGIYRPVWLVSTGTPHINLWGVAAQTLSADAQRAEISVTTEFRAAAFAETRWHGFGKEPQQETARDCALVTAILDDLGNEVAKTESAVRIDNFTEHKLNQQLTVPNPRLWCVENPAMYRIHTTLITDGAVVDDAVTPLGIRTLAWGPEFGFAINGKPVKFKGVCLHQDSAPNGSAVPVKAWVRKLATLKRLGCNAVRTAHHPFPAEFYHCCDALGILVMDEAFDEWARGWERDLVEQPYGKNGYGYSLYFHQWHDADLRAMLRRDRNHPCVLMWSVGNEIPELYLPEGVAITEKLVAICHEEDSSRPVTIGAEGQYRLTLQDGVMAALDIAGYNYVNLRNPNYYEDIHAAHPDWVMVGSETFYDPGHIPAIANHPYATGQFLWVGYDYLGEAHNPEETYDESTGAKRLQHGWPGIVDCLDTPRPEAWYRQSLWAEQPVAHLSVKTADWVQEWWNQIQAADHWNWAVGETKTVYCFTNCQEAELSLNGRVLGRKTKDLADPLPLEWEVPYEPGELTLTGLVDGKPACTHSLRTAGRPGALRLCCDSMTLAAGSVDVAHVLIEVVDGAGTVVPDGAFRVHAEVLGAGSLLSVFNGDMNDAEGYRNGSALTVAGRCMAVVKAGDMAGKVTLRAWVVGLEPVELTVLVN